MPIGDSLAIELAPTVVGVMAFEVAVFVLDNEIVDM